MSGNLLLCGDPHGHFDHIVRVAMETRASAVILLGDLQPRRPLHLDLGPVAHRTWFIHGNHDTDSEDGFRHVWDSEMADRNLHGRVVTLPDGTRVAGLGGVFREKVWYPPAEPRFQDAALHAHATGPWDRWRDGPPLRHWSSIYPQSVDALAALEADVLVMHEAPSCHPNGFELLDDLARAMKVRTVFHGHHHDRLDYSAGWSKLGFQAFGVGLRGITAADGQPLVAGELDLVRSYRRPRFVDEVD
ncbi:MAG: metallophosphoesterase [Methylibium sp.]|uniref:metallophosphoesterase family protein n=1 Tax=Methylibium sp. TaxID=2067992 RepID=UPI0017D90E58|nr:metallophosphoesterase [Methylibium sp.]MBA3599098.1 metallophosphoesterase [Methylibium sp.]